MNSAGNSSPNSIPTVGNRDVPGPGKDQPSSRGVEDDTRTRILDAAERLFAERAYSSVSMRVIASEANANLAAANYHFGSKAGLFEAIFARRIMPINEHRLQLLDACLAQAMGSPLSLNDIAEAYARPLMFCDATAEGECDPPVVMQMLAKVYFDLYEHEHLLTYHEEMSNRFVDAIHQALPDIDHDDVVFKFTSMVAVLLHFARNLNPRSFQPQRPGIPPNSGATDASRYDEKALLRLVAFIGAGMAAELTER